MYLKKKNFHRPEDRMPWRWSPVVNCGASRWLPGAGCPKKELAMKTDRNKIWFIYSIRNYTWIWWLKKRRKVGQFRPNRRRNEWNFGRKLSSQMKATTTTTTATTGSYARRQSFGSKMSRDEPMRSPFLASWRFVYLLPVQLPAQGHPSSLQATFTWPKRDLA